MTENPDILETEPYILGANELNQVEIKAMVWINRLVSETGAVWVSEQQWRGFADRPNHKPETERARGFRIPEMLAKGVIEMTTAAFHTPRNGVHCDPVLLYRPVA